MSQDTNPVLPKEVQREVVHTLRIITLDAMQGQSKRMREYLEAMNVPLEHQSAARDLIKIGIINPNTQGLGASEATEEDLLMLQQRLVEMNREMDEIN